MMKTQKLEYSEQQSLDTCIRQLEALLESLKAASVSLSRNGNKLWLRPGATVDVRLSAEQSGDREQLQICLGWRRRSLSVVARPDTDMPPETVRDWQEIEGQPDVVQEVGDDFTLLSLISVGMGVGFVYASMRRWAPEIIEFHAVTDLKLGFDLDLMWMRDNINPALQEFLTFVNRSPST